MSTDHKAHVQSAFTKQAEAYAVNPAVAAISRGERLVRLAQPAPGWRALDVATGPGYLAEALARSGCEVVGIDLTEAPLRIAEERCRAGQVANIRFQQADAEALPFDGASFDLVCCGWALHHMPDPTLTLAEMVRVCRPGGRLVVDDLVSSERADQAAYDTEIERLRDPSHVRALPASELLRLLGQYATHLLAVETYVVVQDVERWMARAQTPPEHAARVRERFAVSLATEISGLRPFEQDGALYMRHTMALGVWERRSGANVQGAGICDHVRRHSRSTRAHDSAS